MPIASSHFAHIIGMYKSGTSWLLHILSAHPEAIGWAEFNELRSVYSNHGNWGTRSTGLLNGIFRRLGVSPLPNYKRTFKLRSRDEIMRKMFCGHGWVPILDEEKRAAAMALDYNDTAGFIQSLQELKGFQLRAQDAPLLDPSSFHNTLGVLHSRYRDLETLIENVRDTEDPGQIPRYFYDYLQQQCQPGTTLVLKAADQILCLPLLQQLAPDSTKIAIVRDGRDTAISAIHYDALMQQRRSPWQRQSRNFEQRLTGWSDRAQALANYSRKMNITILRYEDLHRDFHTVASALYARLGLAHTPELVEKIYQKTRFTTVTGGRQPGEAAADVTRKGIVGEWKETLSAAEAERAWVVARRGLELFGYTRDGSYQDTELCNLR